jgi:hypothetical protein
MATRRSQPGCQAGASPGKEEQSVMGWFASWKHHYNRVVLESTMLHHFSGNAGNEQQEVFLL